MNGDQISAEIFIGPTYYMRLKHMVKDKINYRSKGPNTALTRQPVQGRSNDGGLRVGEMERDAILAHGASKFLNDSFMIRSDEYYMAVCNISGGVAIYNPSLNLFLSPWVDGPLVFKKGINNDSLHLENISHFGRNFSIVRIPYSLKLLIQELLVMNVQMRIITEENIDQFQNMAYSSNINKLLNTNEEDIETVIKKYKENMMIRKREMDKTTYLNEIDFSTPQLATPPESIEESPQFVPDTNVVFTQEIEDVTPIEEDISPDFAPDTNYLTPEKITLDAIQEEDYISPDFGSEEPHTPLEPPPQELLDEYKDKLDMEKVKRAQEWIDKKIGGENLEEIPQEIPQEIIEDETKGGNILEVKEETEDNNENNNNEYIKDIKVIG
jgi:DNA-directed RNA polymerase II subunit RPB2